ncbi:MAG: phage tail protein, partial [Ktedonobacteraceae bacterium]|nr:phage tail protein [Ktedonobacteraceae bacterium]
MADYPFTTFNFAVEINVPEIADLPTYLCDAAFSECDGLEMTMEVKTIREGGNNGKQIRLT